MTAPTPSALVYTSTDLASALHLAPSTVRLMCQRGEVDATKRGRLWRIPRREYLRLVGDDAVGHEAHGGDGELRRRERALRELIDDLESALTRARRVLDGA